jgi:hypothetical protein
MGTTTRSIVRGPVKSGYIIRGVFRHRLLQNIQFAYKKVPFHTTAPPLATTAADLQVWGKHQNINKRYRLRV